MPSCFKCGDLMYLEPETLSIRPKQGVTMTVAPDGRIWVTCEHNHNGILHRVAIPAVSEASTT